jgi:hypothetical protein
MDQWQDHYFLLATPSYILPITLWGVEGEIAPHKNDLMKSYQQFVTSASKLALE